MRIVLFMMAVLLTPTSWASNPSQSPVVAIIVDDNEPRISLKTAGYLDDFLEYNTQVVTRSQFNMRSNGFAATVDIKISGERGEDMLYVVIVNGKSRSTYTTNIGYSTSTPRVVLENRKALDIATYALGRLSTDSWKGLVKVFKDPVEDLDD